MKLSIISINRNNASGLRKTIESVVSQTYTDFEYIIIDGASTDGSIGVINEFATPLNLPQREKKEHPIINWISELDSGIYNAMNKGILKASGEYLLFLNSGDYLYNSEVLKNVFELDFDEDIVYGEQLVENDGQISKVQFLLPEHISFRSFMTSTLPHQCTFIKRSLFLSIGLYNENNKIVSDWEFNVLALFKFNCLLRKINIAVSVYDTIGISSSLEYMEIHNNEKRNVLYQHFTRFMLDYDAQDKSEKSKAFQLVKVIKKIFK